MRSNLRILNDITPFPPGLKIIIESDDFQSNDFNNFHNNKIIVNNETKEVNVSIDSTSFQGKVSYKFDGNTVIVIFKLDSDNHSDQFGSNIILRISTDLAKSYFNVLKYFYFNISNLDK